jgi:hypothetical protein
MGSQATAERPKVIYVMGAGHSGSSILGVTLGNCNDFFYAGEVEEWLVKGGAGRWGGSQRTNFWKRVADKVDPSAAELFGSEVNRVIERSSAWLRIDRWAARRRMLPRYRSVSEELLLAIASAADTSNVIDTSHFPLRAIELQRLDGIELYLILLVRDAQAVVASNVRHISPHEVPERRFQILAMNGNLWLTYLLSVIVFLRHDRARRMFVSHETFLEQPEAVLRKILDQVGSDAPIPDLSALDVGAPFEGNPLLGSEVVALERTAAKSRRWSRLTTLLAFWTPIFARLRPVAAPAPAPASSGQQLRAGAEGKL